MKMRKILVYARKTFSVLALPKTLRLLCIVMLLLGTLLLFLQDNYGHSRLVVLGRAAWDRSENVLIVNTYISWPSVEEKRLELSASRSVMRQFNDFPVDTEFLMVIRSSGGNQVIERIFALELPEHSTLSGPRWEIEPRMSIAVGSNPQLMEMIGLDTYVYQVRQPVWAREQVPGNDQVMFHETNPRVIKSMLDGNISVFDPDIWLMDTGGRVTHVRKIGATLFTWPELIRSVSRWCYGLAGFFAISAFAMHYRSFLAASFNQGFKTAKTNLAKAKKRKDAKKDQQANDD